MGRARELSELATGYDSGGLFGFRNRIINGAMVIDQRNAGASVSNNGSQSYNLDRWQTGAYGGGVLQTQRSSTAPAGFINSLAITVTTADASVAAGDLYFVSQSIEGLNCSDLNFGSASASTVTFSFQVRSSVTGTFSGSLKNSAANRSYPFTYAISAANTWEQKTVTIAGDTSGTWLTTNGIGITVCFDLGSGTDYTGTANAWAAENNFGADGSTKLISTLNATFYITGVQLEKGSTATSFDYRPYGTELALCQRYCYAQNKLVTNNYYAFGTAFATASTTGSLGTQFPVSMRSNPSITFSAANLFYVDGPVSSSNAFTAITADQVGNNFGYSSFTGGTGGTNGAAGRWLANNAAAAWVIWSAEL